MRRAEPRRSVTKEFKQHLDRTKGWPEKKLIEDWVTRAFGSAWQSGTYSAIRTGRLAAERHLLKFVSYVGHADEPAKYIADLRQVWDRYVLEKADKKLSVLTSEEALELFCTPSP